MEPEIERAPDVLQPARAHFGILGISLLLLLGLTSLAATNALLSTVSSDALPASAAMAATSSPFAGIQLAAKSAYVLDLTNGKVLYARNPDAQLPLASLTKIAMAIAVSQVLPLHTVITIPYSTGYPGFPYRLLKGQQWTVGNVLSFTLVLSSNEGADILSAAAGPAIEARYPQAPRTSPQAATIWRMNQIVRSLGLSQTYYINDNGLDISTTQAGAYGSAHDIAHLIGYAATSSYQAFAATTHPYITLHSVNGATATARNTDDALSNIPGIVIGKTGYTDLAGGNLAIVFDVGPAHPVAIVVLHSTFKGRFVDMQKLVDATIQEITAHR